MASASVGLARGIRAGELLLGSVAAQGSAAHAYPTSEPLLSGREAARNLADVVHFLGALHGRYPGVVDHASNRCVDAEGRRWFGEATYAFAAERAYLARLAVAAGPIPSTPGAADSEGAVIGQRHAMEMLSQSERNGCALGAAMAVILDWTAIRGVLDAAAARFGVERPAWPFADAAAIGALADAFAASAASIQRAMLFGAGQVVIQHFGLWDLLEARQQARDEA
jgi:hypothetical protein